MEIQADSNKDEGSVTQKAVDSVNYMNKERSVSRLRIVQMRQNKQENRARRSANQRSSGMRWSSQVEASKTMLTAEHVKGSVGLKNEKNGLFIASQRGDMLPILNIEQQP